MGLNTLIAKLVGVADRATASLQANVSHYAFRRHSAKGSPEHWPNPTTRACAVILGQGRTSFNERGEQVPLRAELIFPRPVDVHPQDKFILPDGTTGPIVSIDGVVDPATGNRYASSVRLGQ